MTSGTRVGLLDSGVAPELAAHLVGARCFALDRQSDQTVPDPVGHGTTLARIILAQAPGTGLLNAQIFGHANVVEAAVAAAGLDWLVAERACLVNMSLGLAEDRQILAQSCAAARRAGVVLLAASPARGGAVYPAAYPGVIRITGDARCAPGEISALGTAQADFGACVTQSMDAAGPKAGGASFAVAHACGVLARQFGDGARITAEAARRYLDSIARYRGPERRNTATSSTAADHRN
ncbi:MAG: S8 family serine peptidase [Alphaproteobacteria bacterium]|jgi:hypothetical protein|nr:S8 family serine peptidase [Alphaproteobacteria bacterium]